MAFFILITCISCSEDSPTYTPLELYDIAVKYDSDISQVRLNDLNRPNCLEYSKGCIQEFVFRYKVRKVEMSVVMFDTQENAKKAAFKVGQYYVRNWLFDDVAGEPVLEHFVTDAFKAQRPTKDDFLKE